MAVIKKGEMEDINGLEDLRGKHACFAGVGTQAGWTLPLYRFWLQGRPPPLYTNFKRNLLLNFLILPSKIIPYTPKKVSASANPTMKALFGR